MSKHLGSIVGQTRVVNTLQKFIKSQQIPHAMLFSGTKNVGQHFVAKQFLKELLFNEYPDKDFDHKIDKLEEPFIKYVIALPRVKGEVPDDSPLSKFKKDDLELLQAELDKKIKNPFYEIEIEKANNIKISSVRDIKKYLSINFEDLRHRLIIIEEAHLMSTEAQNALLKSLEEPPDGVIFVLISDKPEKLLTTIKSRCREITFSPLYDKEIEQILINNFIIETSEAKKVIPFSDGSIHRVFVLLNFGFENLVDTTINILRYSMARRYNTAIKLFTGAIEENPKLIIPIIVQLLISWLNDVQKYKAGIETLQFTNHKETITKFIDKFESAEIDTIVFKLTELNKNIDFNINLNLIILNIIFNLSALAKR
jgi:DNA polymerase-3 subunit delta'